MPVGPVAPVAPETAMDPLSTQETLVELHTHKSPLVESMNASPFVFPVGPGGN
jgi:hypothetical protein